MVLKGVDKNVSIELIIIPIKSLDKVLSRAFLRKTVMARITNNELDRLKREVSLVRLVELSGIELKKL